MLEANNDLKHSFFFKIFVLPFKKILSFTYSIFNSIFKDLIVIVYFSFLMIIFKNLFLTFKENVDGSEDFIAGFLEKCLRDAAVAINFISTIKFFPLDEYYMFFNYMVTKMISLKEGLL